MGEVIWKHDTYAPALTTAMVCGVAFAVGGSEVAGVNVELICT